MSEFDKSYLSELTSFYRFEGEASFHYYNFDCEKFLDKTNNYIYFSKSKVHHDFYVKQRMRQLINKGLNDKEIKLTKYFIVGYENYRKIVKAIESYDLSYDLSIIMKVSPLMDLLLENNYVLRHLKGKNMRYIERVDTTRPGDGGYGFSNEWLEIFNMLTYFYAYLRITKDDLLYFIDAFRYNVVHNSDYVNTVAFLENEDRRKIKINEQINDNFSKYKLMDLLKILFEQKMYLPGSYMDVYQEKAIKKL